MLHYCLSGEKITPSEFQIVSAGKAAHSQTEQRIEQMNHRASWGVEQMVLKLVED